MGLHERRHLDVRVSRAPVFERHGGVVQHVAKNVRLTRAHCKLFKLSRTRNNLEQALELGLRRERRGEELDRGVGDVVVRTDHAQVERGHVHVVLDADALARLEVAECRLHQLRERVGEVPVSHPGEVVVVGVLAQSAVVERPGEIVHRVLLRLDGSRHNLRRHVIVKEMVEVGLNREGFVQEFLVVLLPRRVAQQDAHAVVVVQWPRRTTHHREKIGDGIVGRRGAARVVVLRAHDHRQLARGGETPRERGGDHENSRRARREHPLNQLALIRVHGLVKKRDTETERVSHGGIRDLVDVRRQILGVTREELFGLPIRGGKREQVERSQLCVLARGHKHDGGLAGRRVLTDGAVHGPGHRLHTRLEVDDVDAGDADIEGHRPDRRGKVEEAVRRRADPLAQVPRVGQRSAKTDDANRLFELGADVPHAARDHLHDRSHRASNQVELIRDEERDVLHVFPLLPPAADHVPLLWRGDDHLALLEQLQVNRRLARQRYHTRAELVAEPRAPVLQPLARQLRRGRHVHASHGVGFLLGQLVEHAQDGKLGADRLAAAGGRADECVVVGVVHALEHLGLHRVEVLDPGRVETVKSILLQRRRRQGLQVEQLRGRRVLVRKEQVLEADWDDRLRPEPAVGHHAHEVLGRQGVEQGDGEGNRVVLLGVDLLEQKEFVVKDHLAIVVLDDDPEALHVPVHLLVPLKVRGEGQVHLEH